MVSSGSSEPPPIGELVDVGGYRLHWPSPQSSSGEPSAKPATAPVTIQRSTFPSTAPMATPPAPKATHASAAIGLGDAGWRSSLGGHQALIVGAPHAGRCGCAEAQGSAR
jgi:hypothetical protein